MYLSIVVFIFPIGFYSCSLVLYCVSRDEQMVNHIEHILKDIGHSIALSLCSILRVLGLRSKHKKITQSAYHQIIRQFTMSYSMYVEIVLNVCSIRVQHMHERCLMYAQSMFNVCSNCV